MKKTLILFAVLLILSFSIINYYIFPIKHKSYIVEYSQQYNLQPSLVASLINAESNFNTQAVSHKGAVGLMQLMPSTAQWIYSQLYSKTFNKEVLTNAKVNIQLGCFYLNYLINKFDNTICVLCAYNAGETVVRSWIANGTISAQNPNPNNIPYPETKNYVKKILNYSKVYANKI